MKKLYSLTGGGGGDVKLNYLHPNFDMGYVRQIKEKYPGTQMKLYIWTVNPNAKLFHQYNPLIDELVVRDMCPEWEQFTHAEELGKSVMITQEDKREFQWERPPIFLDPEEKSFAESITDKFVVIHAFAGSNDRDLISRIDLRRAIDVICDKGIMVILVGGNSYRLDQGKEMVEDFSYQRPFLLNLLNLFSPRLHSYLTSKAWRFIGSVSAYNCVAAACGVKSLLFTCPGNRDCVNTHDCGIFWMLREQKTEIYYWDQMPVDPIGIISKFCS